jgi:solute carrier family 25 (mitochondrial phosphate transporter), member 23/24/25/41
MQCETVKGGLQGNALIFATAKTMWNQTGMWAYYRGLGMGLIGMFPYSAIDLTTYEYLKRLIITRNLRRLECSEEDAAPGRMLTGGIGAISSSFGASVVYPVNLLRTRLQSQGTVIHPPTYDGWVDCLRKTVRGEGIRALYKGLTPNLLKVVPSMSISYVMYEQSKKLLDLR